MDMIYYLQSLEKCVITIHLKKVMPVILQLPGNQIRFPRLLSVYNVANRAKNYDDESTTFNCSKKYPSVALKGTIYMFLWFCPQHGHCCGFDFIDGIEGRKDPANSLISYLKRAPQVIFYDFACSLEEYCFNRESRCFDNTKFYHDIFHGFSHSCSPAYNSKFLSSVGGVNTSICEQFNSYLQCTKASAKHISQVNFMFFAQYIIHIWNKSKKKSFKKKLLFATATICYCEDMFDNNDCIYFPGRKFCFTSDYYNP